MTDHWKKWIPINGLSAKYDIDEISNINGFTILLTEIREGNKVRVIFEKSIESFMRTEEGFMGATINAFHEKYDGEFYGFWTFFKITNSSYIKWLSEQTYGASDNRPFIHFSFFAANVILDVISTYEPKVELIPEQKIKTS